MKILILEEEKLTQNQPMVVFENKKNQPMVVLIQP